MDRLRVCIDATLPAGIAGGLEQFVIGLTAGLSKLSDGDEEYLLLVPEGADGWIRPYVGGSCRLLYTSTGRLETRAASMRQRLLQRVEPLRELARVVPPLPGLQPSLPGESDGTAERSGASVMHFTQQMAFFTSLPSIYHPHDLQHVHLPQYFTRRGRWARENAYRRFCKRADIVAVGTSWVKDDIVAHFGLPKEKVEVIPLAPPLDVYDPVDNATVLACATRLQLPKEFIFYPAQTWPHKNHIGLLEALALLRDRYGIAVPLVSSGRQTEFYPRIVRRATELGLFDHCRFLGFTNPTDLQCVYKLCRGVVIPTKFEAASFPLWEAFTAGAPAACANVTSLPAQAGDAALLFDPNDPGEMADVIYRLWADDALRQTLVRRGRENVERFSWDRTARTFRAHYRRLGRRPLTEEDMMLISAPPLL